MKRESFTSASALPLKLMKLATTAVDYEGIIHPLHVQISPTNKCNLFCDFCSCANREVREELSKENMHRLIRDISASGTLAVTITGGGEPLLYQHLNYMVDELFSRGIRIGLVTNGILLGKTDKEVLRKLTWCRISVSDDRDVEELLASVNVAVIKAPKVDWAFSYVCLLYTSPSPRD